MLEVNQELMQEHVMNLDDALAVWDKSIAHPAWHKLAQRPAKTLEQI